MINLESVRAHVETLIWVKKRKRELDMLEDAAQEAIKAVMNTDEQGALDGEVVVTWATHKKRQLQQKALKDAHPEIAEEFTSLVEGRQFKVL